MMVESYKKKHVALKVVHRLCWSCDDVLLTKIENATGSKSERGIWSVTKES